MERPRERRCVLFAVHRGGAQRTPIFGLTPVERTVLGFLRAGVRHFLIAGDAEAAAEVVEILGRGPCRAARASRVSSLVSALDGDELFFLARTDCHYDRRVIARFVAETRDAGGTVVAVDFRSKPRLAPAGLPRIAVWSGGTSRTVRAVAAELMGADGVWTGLALATPCWARELARSPDGERGWLASLAALLNREPVEAWPVLDRWRAVWAPADLRAARREVLAGAVRGSDGPIARHLNRRISLRITERLLSRDVKPWQVTLTSFALTLTASAAFALGQAAAGGLLAQAASVMAGVDGELARVRYQDSAFGWIYDALLNGVGDAALIGGMTLYAWLMGAGHAAVVLGFVALQGSSLSTLVQQRYGGRLAQPWEEERQDPLRWLLLGRDGRLFLALVAGITGQVVAVLAYLAVGTHANAGARIFRLRAEASSA